MEKGSFLSAFSIFFIFLVPLVVSRSLSESAHTSVLDVSGAIERTVEILSFDPETGSSLRRQEPNITTLTPSASPSSTLSLQLHPRYSLQRTAHKDYRAVVLSRLERDAARVNSLNSKLQLAVNGVQMSDLLPTETELQPEDLSTPVVSGTSQGSGEYFSRVGIGSPPKSFYMVPDTGSDINWLQCRPCSSCYSQSDPIFDPKGSSSYSPFGCSSRECRALEVSSCRNNLCTYQVSYGDGSYTVGDFASETVSFGSSGSVPHVAIGCGHDNEGLFVGSAGLLGLGGGPLSITSQIKAKSFSYCFVDRDSSSSSTLDFNSARPADSITTQLIRNNRVNTFFYIQLTGLSVGGQLLSIPPSIFQVDESGRGGIIVDSGTAVTRLQSQAYNSLRDAFRSRTRDLPTTNGVAIFDTCYDLSSKTSVRVPTVSFHFAGGKSLDLPAKNYMVPVDSGGTFCLAFAPTTSLSIIGNIQQQGTRVSYDLANSLVGFSPNKC